MKKSLFVLFGMMFLFNGVAQAEQRCGECVCGSYSKDNFMGGFVDSDLKPMSVDEVDKMSDDSYVFMVGHIVKQVGDEKYEFSDGTNSIILKIKPKIWQGQKVTPKDKIMIMGEVDKDFVSKREVKVKSLKLI